MAHPQLWPDFKLRCCDPDYFRTTTSELMKIIRALLIANQAGQCTVFFRYFPHTGSFEIELFEGRWNYCKKPVARFDIDCRDDILRDAETDKPLDADIVIEKIMLILQ